jgi:hypothetical protein
MCLGDFRYLNAILGGIEVKGILGGQESFSYTVCRTRATYAIRTEFDEGGVIQGCRALPTIEPAGRIEAHQML